MKKLLLLTLAFLLNGLFFVSCEKQDVASDDLLIRDIATDPARESIEPGQLPGEILSYLEDYYFDSYVESAFRAPNRGYELTMGSGEVLFFDLRGRLMEFRGPVRPNGPFGLHGPHGPCYNPDRGFSAPVRVENLPQSILDYISANYPDNQARRAKIVNREFFIVAVDVPVLLKFDREGNFIEELTPLHNCHQSCRPVRYDQLPEAAAAYLTENYPEGTFRVACARSGHIAVWLQTDTGRIIVVFDREGNFLFDRP